MAWSPVFEEYLRKSRFTQLVIWAALTASAAIHVGLAYVLTTVIPLKMPTIPSSLPTILFVLAAGEAACSIGARRFLMAPSRLLRRLAEPVDPDGLALAGGSGPASAALAGEIRQMPPAARAWVNVLRDMQNTTLICLFLNESTVLLGLVAAILEQRFAAILPFAILGICQNLVMIPRPREELAELAELAARQPPGRP